MGAGCEVQRAEFLGNFKLAEGRARFVSRLFLSGCHAGLTTFQLLRCRKSLAVSLLSLLALFLVLYVCRWMFPYRQVWKGYVHDQPVELFADLLELDCSVNAIAFSPDGQLMATGCGSLGIDIDETDWVADFIRVWQTENGQLVSVLSEYKDVVYDLAFSPDGRLLASAGWDGEKGGGVVRIWEVKEGRVTRTLVKTIGDVTALAFSPDGRLLATSRGKWNDGEMIDLWNTNDWRLVCSLKGHKHNVNDLAFSPDGTLLASGSSDATVRVWRVADGKPFHTFVGHRGVVNSVSFSPDSHLLVSGGGYSTSGGSNEGEVLVWNLRTGKLVRKLQGHTDWVESVSFSPEGRWIASGSWDGTVRLWRVASGTQVYVWHLAGRWRIFMFLPLFESDSATKVAFSPNGKLLAVGTRLGFIRTFRVP